MPTSCLQDEAEHVTYNEKLRHRATADNGELVSVRQLDDAPQYHVYCCSEQSGRDQDEGALDNIWYETVLARRRRGGLRTTGISNELNWTS
jgi:hypothetical protein